MAPDRELEYPELLALWRTVPLSWRKLCRKDAACLALDLIQKYKPGIRLTAEGRPTKHVHKKRQYVAVGPALAAILDRPELAALKGGDELVAAKASQEYRQNRIAQDNLKNIVEARLGYQYETVKVSFWESDERVSFRIRSGHRGHALRAIEQVLQQDELDDIWEIEFRANGRVRQVQMGRSRSQRRPHGDST